MANLQIKDLPDDVHEELRRRARMSGMTLRGYVLRLILDDQATVPRQEWLARIRARPRIDFGTPVSDLVAADRRSRYGTANDG